MSRLAGDQSGFTLTEVLIVSLLMIIIMGATLTAMTSMERSAQQNQRQNENQDFVRRGLDRLARELRNLASPTNELPQAVLRAESNDLIFQSVAPTKTAGSLNVRNTQLVRYCYDASTSKLWRQEQRWTTATAPGMPTSSSCPSTPVPLGWDTKRAVAQNVVNATRPVFTYNSTVATSITEIRASLFADATPGKRPGEVELETSVFLRNQNRSPVASFTASVNGTSIVLNGSASQDPEEKALEFYWYDDDRTTNSCGALPPEVPTAGCVGNGIVYNYSPSTLGTKRVHLVARDPAGLTSTAPTKTVCLLGALGVCP